SVKIISPLPPATDIGSPGAAVPAGTTGLHNPVMPSPEGIARSHTATCGRRFVALLVIVASAPASPVDAASTVMVPSNLVDCTTAIHDPENAIRDVPISDSWLVGSPFPTPASFPGPV